MAGCSGLSGFSSTALLEKNANHEQHISAASQKDSAQDYNTTCAAAISYARLPMALIGLPIGLSRKPAPKRYRRQRPIV